MGKRFDLTGRRFGRLTVLHRDPEDYLPLSGVSCPRWVCRCECGETVTVVARSLLYGRTRSCGCLRRENAGRRARGLPLREGDEPVKRYCKRFFCDHLGDRFCCAACRYRADCGNPCLNHPSRCGLEDTERAATPQPAKPAAPLAGEPKGDDGK